MKTNLILILFMGLTIPAFSFEHKPYVGASLGYTSMSVTVVDGLRKATDNSTLYNIAVGTRINKTRLELAYNGRPEMKDTISVNTTMGPLEIESKLKMHALMANVYQVLNEDDFTSFYIGVGLGISQSKSVVNIHNLKNYSDKDSNPILGIYFGLTSKISQNIDLDIGADWYRWQHLDRNITNWSPRLALRYTF